MNDPLVISRELDLDELRSQLDQSGDSLKKLLSVAEDVIEEDTARAALPAVGESDRTAKAAQPKPMPSPQRRKREFSGRVAQMRKQAQRGVLPSTEDLESIILAIALRSVNSMDTKKAATGLDLLLQVYSKRTTAKHAPGNKPRGSAASEEQF